VPEVFAIGEILAALLVYAEDKCTVGRDGRRNHMQAAPRNSALSFACFILRRWMTANGADFDEPWIGGGHKSNQLTDNSSKLDVDA